MRILEPTTRFALLATLLAIATVLSPRTSAYTTSSRGWPSSAVNYFVNASNLDLSAPAAEAAVRLGADAWAAQSRARFRFDFAGASAQTTNTNDGVNLVVFRNASNGSAIATTYWWSNSAGIIDADIVFWDGAFRFFTGATGCANGFYIEDIAAHEFGHALGLGHSPEEDDVMIAGFGRGAKVGAFSEHETVTLRMMYRHRRAGNAFPDKAPELTARDRTLRLRRIVN